MVWAEACGCREVTIPNCTFIHFGTANPTPAFSEWHAEGDNLYTSCLVALNVDSGKLAWYFQPSPHDTHDWDSGQTPVIVDGEFNGKPRKLLLDASRNGYFFCAGSRYRRALVDCAGHDDRQLDKWF